MTEMIGDTADGPSGQIVVCRGGQAMPGLMFSQTSVSSDRSLGRPSPAMMRLRMRSSQGEEAHDVVTGLDHVGVFVHDDDGARSEHGTGLVDRGLLKRQIEMLVEEPDR